MNKAIFLDRDGVINKEMGRYVFTKEDFRFEEGIFDLGRQAIASGFLLIVVTNQGGIQKGIYTIEQADALHQFMIQKFQDEGCPLTEVYLSPYHQDISKNILSKPSSLMIEKACNKYKIIASQSWMIGDRERDIVSGRLARCKTAGIGTDTINARPDVWADSVKSLANSGWGGSLSMDGLPD
jgi:D-glycero-D-manno-heptose 1,7-bisphosphate phosphatase